jgi:hypothetical protein
MQPLTKIIALPFQRVAGLGGFVCTAYRVRQNSDGPLVEYCCFKFSAAPPTTSKHTLSVHPNSCLCICLAHASHPDFMRLK